MSMNCEWPDVVSPDAARRAAGDDIRWMQGGTTNDEVKKQVKQGEGEGEGEEETWPLTD